MSRGRRRSALVTVGILLLSACTTPQPESPAEPSTSSTPAPAHDREPRPASTALPEADTAGLWLPLNFQDARIVDPGWDTEVHHAEGVFVGAQDHGDHLTYAAVDVHGEVLWQAERPSGSTELEVRTDEEGQPVVVLPDREPEGTVTVSGHDLRTGERIWGPEEPPGPGPADTEAATPDPGAEGEGHLDPATGTLITLEGTTLSAEAADGSQLWTLSVEEGTRVAGLAGGLLYLREGDAIRAHNAVTGAVAQAYDPDGEGRVVVPRMMVTHGAALLLDGDRPLIATAPEASPAPGMAPTP